VVADWEGEGGCQMSMLLSEFVERRTFFVIIGKKKKRKRKYKKRKRKIKEKKRKKNIT
jgi:hypothetical protein